jgi:hypothetical protein
LIAEAGDEVECALVKGLNTGGEVLDLAQVSGGGLGIEVREGREIEGDLLEERARGVERELSGGVEEEKTELGERGLEASGEYGAGGDFAHGVNPP